MPETITFLASFPAIQSAIKIGQDGMRIQLDIPESEMGNAVELLAMRNVVLSITATALKNSREQTDAVCTRRERKSKGQAAQAEGVE